MKFGTKYLYHGAIPKKKILPTKKNYSPQGGFYVKIGQIWNFVHRDWTTGRIIIKFGTKYLYHGVIPQK